MHWLHNQAGNGVAFTLSPSKCSSNLFSPSPHRYANTRHPAVRYSAYVRQRPPLVLLCLLHLWDCRCAALGRAAEKQVFPRQEFCNVSTAKKISTFSSFLSLPCRRNPGGQQGQHPAGVQPGLDPAAESTTWLCCTAAMAALNWAVILIHEVVGFRTPSLARYFLYGKTHLSAGY